MGVFTEAERRALAYPERITPSQWAEKYRYLTEEQSAESGPFRNERKAYMVGIADALIEPVDEIVFLKGARLGFTTSLMTQLGYIVDVEPGNILLVYPDETEAKNVASEDLQPFIEVTPKIKSHLSKSRYDVTQDFIRFDTCPLFMAWATASKTLNRRNCRYVFCDEVDNFVRQSNQGRDAGPLDLARKRASTFLRTGRGRIIIGGTPKYKDGHMWRAWEGVGDKREYYVPCPKCGEYQTLRFPQLKWDSPKELDNPHKAEYVEAHNTAYYECINESCKHHWNDLERDVAVKKGKWLSETQTITPDGVIHGDKPKAKRIGFKLSSLYTPDVTLAQMAARFLRAEGDRASMMEFKNQWLAEPFDDALPKASLEDAQKKFTTAPAAKKLPNWCHVLIATADVHGEAKGYYWTIRAWGYNYRSQLIDAGRCHTLEELKAQTLGRQFMVEGTTASYAPQVLYVDCGYKPAEVHEFCRTDPIRIKAVKGNTSKAAKPRKTEQVLDFRGNTLAEELSINTDYYKSKLRDYQNQQLLWAGMEVDRWAVCQLPTEIEGEYCKHLVAEVEKYDPKANRMVFVPITERTPNHFWDCEVYQLAAADEMGVAGIPEPKQVEPIVEKKPEPKPVSEVEKEVERIMSQPPQAQQAIPSAPVASPYFKRSFF